MGARCLGASGFVLVVLGARGGGEMGEDESGSQDIKGNFVLGDFH